MAAIPDSVKVGPHSYSIVRETKSTMPDLMGDSNFDLMRIRLRKGIRKSKMQETLLHEILHTTTYPCFTGAYEEDEKYTPEQIISAISPLLLQVIQDNPDLLEYLTQ